MPTYEYACRNCGSHLEVVQSFTDDALTDCPHCGGSLRKVFGSIGITFKGSGFYKTDSRPAASSKKAAGDGAGDKKEKKETKKEPAAASDSGGGSGTASGTAKTAS
jgi:putative FmdB family regulatory protein